MLFNILVNINKIRQDRIKETKKYILRKKINPQTFCLEVKSCIARGIKLITLCKAITVPTFRENNHFIINNIKTIDYKWFYSTF